MILSFAGRVPSAVFVLCLAAVVGATPGLADEPPAPLDGESAPDEEGEAPPGDAPADPAELDDEQRAKPKKRLEPYGDGAGADEEPSKRVDEEAVEAEDGGSDPLEDVRQSVQGLPTPILGALGAGLPALLTFGGALLVAGTVVAIGRTVDFNTGTYFGSVGGALGMGVTYLIGSSLATFGMGAALLWLLGQDATEQDWNDLYIVTLAVAAFFVVLPFVLILQFVGLGCLANLCPQGLDSLAPRVVRPVYWTLGVGILLGVAGMFGGGFLGSYLGSGLGGLNPNFAIGAIISGAAIGFAAGLSIGAPLGSLVGGAIGISASPARPNTTVDSRRGVKNDRPRPGQEEIPLAKIGRRLQSGRLFKLGPNDGYE